MISNYFHRPFPSIFTENPLYNISGSWDNLIQMTTWSDLQAFFEIFLTCT